MGRSLVPIFKGQMRPEHDPLYFHFGTDRALRKGSRKLVSAKKGAWERTIWIPIAPNGMISLVNI